MIELEREKERIIRQAGQHDNIWEIGGARSMGIFYYFFLFPKSDIILKQTKKNVIGTKESV